MAFSADQFAVGLSGGAFLLLLFYIAAYRPVILVAFFFILFSMALRTAATMFIDLAGPVYSSQLVRYIGPGTATTVHVIAYALTLLPFLILLSPKFVARWVPEADRAPSPEGPITLSDLTVVLSAALMALLYFDLVRIGVIPVFARMERWVYTSQYAGAAHRWLIEYGNFLCFWWGLIFAAERLRNGRIDYRLLGLLVVLFGYMLLTGNRFSAFYSFGSFFAMPFAAVMVVKLVDRPGEGAFSWFTAAIGRRERAAIAIVMAASVSVAALGLYNSLVNVRGYLGSDAFSQFLERSLVQPSELEWVSYERVFLRGQWSPERAFDFLFMRPIDAAKNTTPQYLMLEAIGEPRTYDHISRGFQFAGGFPEIYFELFGPYLAWPFFFGAGWIAAALTALFVRGTIQGHYATAFFSLYALFGLYVMYIGGMLNFPLVWTYWVKIAALAAAIVLERSLSRQGLALVPWVLIPVPARIARIGFPSLGLGSKASN